MKKFILVIASFVVVLIVVGAFWNLEKQKEHAFDDDKVLFLLQISIITCIFAANLIIKIEVY